MKKVFFVEEHVVFDVPYSIGDEQLFEDDLADRLVNKGVAEYVIEGPDEATEYFDDSSDFVEID